MLQASHHKGFLVSGWDGHAQSLGNEAFNRGVARCVRPAATSSGPRNMDSSESPWHGRVDPQDRNGMPNVHQWAETAPPQRASGGQEVRPHIVGFETCGSGVRGAGRPGLAARGARRRSLLRHGMPQRSWISPVKKCAWWIGWSDRRIVPSCLHRELPCSRAAPLLTNREDACVHCICACMCMQAAAVAWAAEDGEIVVYRAPVYHLQHMQAQCTARRQSHALVGDTCVPLV
eukprot:357646-Chlamydomonas_euryale.AAC.1